MRVNNKVILIVLYILAWIIFVGISIEAGGFLTNAAFALIKPAVIPKLWHQVDLSSLANFNIGYFFTQTFIIGIVLVLKACLFYLIIKMLHDKKLNMKQPFNKALERFLIGLSVMSACIGLVSLYGARYAESLTKQGVQMPDLQQLRIGGADVWLFMAVILFVIVQIFKKGIEIQSENELTV